MKKYVIFSGVAWLVVFAGCSSQSERDAVVKSVKAEMVSVYGGSEMVTFPGKIVAASDINLAFRVGGPIVRMHVDVGSFVRKGQVLGEIDPRDYEVQLAATQAEYQQVRNEAERIMELFEKQSVAPNDRDKALYGLQQMEAKLNAHTHALEDTKLLAPCNGYIQKRFFEPGETVGVGLPVLSMISSGAGEVEIHIPSSEYIRREEFESYSCLVDIFPDYSFPLSLVGITRKANMNQLYTMRFRLDGDHKHIPGPGMATMVTIRYRPEGPELVSVPLSSVFEAEPGIMVWVYHPSTEMVTARLVQVSEILTNGRAVISSGLSKDEMVVSAGVHSLKEGERVKLLPQVSSTNVGGML
ncbi:MAG: efflux RND transporter periplasmic adaptor subunit [Tannerellaceae bacterium]|nr:efflux RND transporter periplasmic adaptor subunit [Tannerellaceae bacterium]